MRLTSLPFVSSALAVLLVGPLAVADEPGALVRTGMIVSVKKSALSIEDGGTRYAYVVPDTATITLDGTAAKLSELQPGDTVEITADRAGDSAAAMLIEARRKSDTPNGAPLSVASLAAPSRSPPAKDPNPPETELISGKLVMAGHDSLVAQVNGQERMFKVSPNVEIRKDGHVVMLAALSRDDLLNLTARRSGEDLLLERIDATSAY